MGDVIFALKKAIEAFDHNDLVVFENYGRFIFNYFNVYPSSLEHQQHYYLIGTVYSYLEGALRDHDDTHRVCFENACYCFSQEINSEKIFERQCASIRLFLLLNDNASASFNLIYGIIKEYSPKIHGEPLKHIY